MIINDNDYVLISDGNNNNFNNNKIEGSIYEKKENEYKHLNKTFKVKVDDDVISIDIVDSRQGEHKISLGGVRNRNCDNKKDCIYNLFIFILYLFY